MTSQCQCPQADHEKHPSGQCVVGEMLYPIKLQIMGERPTLLWVCRWCYEVLEAEREAAHHDNGGKTEEQ